MEKTQTPAQAIEAARVAGFDLSLVDCNLALTPEERLLRHDAALELAQQFRKAGELHRAQLTPPAATTR